MISLDLALRKPEAVISWLTSRAKLPWLITGNRIYKLKLWHSTRVNSGSEWFMKLLGETLANIDTAIELYLICDSYRLNRRSQWPCGLRRRSAATRLLRLWVRIPPGTWMCCLLWVSCVVRYIGLCDKLITRPEECYWRWWVVMCDLETSWMRRLWPTGGCLPPPPNKKKD